MSCLQFWPLLSSWTPSWGDAQAHGSSHHGSWNEPTLELCPLHPTIEIAQTSCTEGTPTQALCSLPPLRPLLPFDIYLLVAPGAFKMRI